MEKFAITIHRNGQGNISMFNTALFSTRKEAEKYRQWYMTKISAERVAHHKFWGTKIAETQDDVSLEIAKVEVQVIPRPF